MRNYAIVALVSAVIGAVLVYNLYPRVEVKTQVQEKIVVRNDIRTVTRLIERPDGTKESVTETVDNSEREASKSTTVVKNMRKDYLAGVGAGVQFKDLKPIYSATVARRMFGPAFAGAYGRTDGEFGLTFTLEF